MLSRALRLNIAVFLRDHANLAAQAFLCHVAQIVSVHGNAALFRIVRRNKSETREDFPAPLAPTMASFSPAFTCSLIREPRHVPAHRQRSHHQTGFRPIFGSVTASGHRPCVCGTDRVRIPILHLAHRCIDAHQGKAGPSLTFCAIRKDMAPAAAISPAVACPACQSSTVPPISRTGSTRPAASG